MTPWLACRAVAKRLGSRQILSGLDLEVREGEILSILGPSGSGKTTLIRLIAGLADPDSGEIAIAGRPVWDARTNVRIEERGVGFVFQDYAVWPHMTVAENVGFGLRMARMPAALREQRVREALDSVHIGDLAGRYPDQLSGGQQQRLALARSLAMRPRLILMDEPLSNVDAGLREHLRLEILQAVRAHGTTAIYITHDQSEAMALCDRLAIMHDGRIVQAGPPEALYRRPDSRFVAGFLGGVNALPGRMDGCLFAAGTLRLHLDQPARAGSGLDMELVFRPEDAVGADSLGLNRIEVVVESCIFLGRCWRLSARHGGRLLQLDWPAAVSPGPFAFAVPPDRCTLVAASGEAMRGEGRVEG